MLLFIIQTFSCQEIKSLKIYEYDSNPDFFAYVYERYPEKKEELRKHEIEKRRTVHLFIYDSCLFEITSKNHEIEEIKVFSFKKFQLTLFNVDSHEINKIELKTKPQTDNPINIDSTDSKINVFLSEIDAVPVLLKFNMETTFSETEFFQIGYPEISFCFFNNVLPEEIQYGKPKKIKTNKLKFVKYTIINEKTENQLNCFKDNSKEIFDFQNLIIVLSSILFSE